ncbi:hypothetical protein ACGFI9_19035 [Micromonospora sp. NPDC048930]|uniref:hypothetical protein n=1 Tax=Micromonospora sp. NPDC048930 TaxID=3364261 RepID=UPI003717C274
MRTLWDREVADEAELVGRLSPAGRMELTRQVLDWTIEALPSDAREILAGRPGQVVDAAISDIRAVADGAEPTDEADEIEDELLELSDEVELQSLWQLFNALSYCIGLDPSELETATTQETMSACYDVIRDCEDLPEFPVGTDEATVLAAERANDNCMRAIDQQKELIGEALRRDAGR